MAFAVKNWPLASYTNSTWTDLVSATAATLVKSLSVAGGSGAAEVKLRLADSGGSSLAVIVPSAEVLADTGYVWELSNVALESGQKLQVWADVAGVEFIAFGAHDA